MAKLGPLADGVAKISRFIHELQRERGASAVFLGSKGAQMREELPAQRKRTEAERQAATNIVTQLNATATGEFKNAIGRAEAAVGALEARRKEIDAQSIAAPVSSAYFTDTIAKLLGVTDGNREGQRPGQCVHGGGGLCRIHSRQGTRRPGARVRRGQHRRRQVRAGKLQPRAGPRRVAGSLFRLVLVRRHSRAARVLQQDELAGTVSDTVAKMRAIIGTGGLSGEMTGLDGKSWFDATTARIDACSRRSRTRSPPTSLFDHDVARRRYPRAHYIVRPDGDRSHRRLRRRFHHGAQHHAVRSIHCPA